MANKIFLFLAIMLLIAVFPPITYVSYSTKEESETPFFGVSFGGKTANEAKTLIDKVKGYTNFFLINSWDIATNETALDEVCDYAAKADLDFMVYFSWISRIVFAWHQTWLDTAKERWGDRFLGVYLFDELGGRQIDTGGWNGGMAPAFDEAYSFGDAADIFVNGISSISSTQDLNKRDIQMFTSDYALYWFDYLAGYDTVFAELAWNHSRAVQIGLCRGAAHAQGKDWGAIITWTYDEPPHLASGPEILEEMLIAYETGARYIIVFNYPTYPEGNLFGILADEHFEAMQRFWTYMHQTPADYGRTKAEAVFVLPDDYGFGMRRPEDSIWGLWQADYLSSVIWNKTEALTAKYGLHFDIVYDDPRFSLNGYSEVYYWNSTIV